VRCVVKRGLDVAGAVILLVLAAPLMALTALLVSIDGGPVFYSHRRIGRGGKSFGCLKWRTMIVGAEECLPEYLAFHPQAADEWRRNQKLTFDPRVTGIGKFLRRTSFDELPQLLNVLRGEMSLVGPRPVTAVELEERYGSHACVYCSVTPGVTGLWQVSGRSETCYDARVELDMQYIASWSITRDLSILFKTIEVIASRGGAR
jgi:lipopolysaccharide/colanic/teichoic acid biosynthesis glycosyltransferase